MGREPHVRGRGSRVSGNTYVSHPKASDTDTVKSLIDKLEYKAENTLTIADIISVLTSLSKWKVKGDCAWGGGLDALGSIESVDRDSIKVRVSRRYRELESWETLQVDGPIVKFDIIKQICLGREMIFEGKSLNCEVGFAVEVEVVSKTKVIVRTVQNRVTGWMDDRIGNKKQCELSPPK